MPSIESITFDTTDLSFQGDKGNVRVWSAPSGDGVGLYYFPIKPDILVDIKSITSVRSFYGEQVAAAKAGVISIDTLNIDKCTFIKMIIKVPQQPFGMIYLGSLTLPFKNFSFVIKMQCSERGETGLREAIIMNELLATGEVKADPSGKMSGWLQEPYNTNVVTTSTMNKAEAEKYDLRFPKHPLSILRHTLKQIEDSIHVSEEVKREPTF